MDEGGFIEVGEAAVRIAFVEHDFRHPFWADPYWNYGAYNPRLGVLIVGAMAKVAGRVAPEDQEKKLSVMRLTMSLLSMAVVVLLFFLVLRLTDSRPAAHDADRNSAAVVRPGVRLGTDSAGAESLADDG